MAATFGQLISGEALPHLQRILSGHKSSRCNNAQMFEVQPPMHSGQFVSV